MKLKKIASLALAGVMAVSMLAGCSTTSVEPTPNPDDNNSVVTPANGYSATFADALTGVAAIDGKINMSDSAELTADLNSAIRNLSSPTMTKFFTSPWGSDTLDLPASGFSAYNDVEWIIDAMDAVGRTTAFKTLKPSATDLTGETAYEPKTVTMLFMVEANVEEDAAVEQVAKRLNNDIGLLYRDNDSTPEWTCDVDHTNVGYTYTGSVSVASKTWISNDTVGVHLIAVQITRTAIA